jgi:hypothetical protein
LAGSNAGYRGRREGESWLGSRRARRCRNRGGERVEKVDLASSPAKHEVLVWYETVAWEGKTNFDGVLR